MYALASVAFVGGSLVPAGGHNPLEPAQFAVPVVMGTHYANFRAIIDTLVYAEALKLATNETLVPMLENLLTDAEAANTLGVRALEVFHHQSGATGRAITALLGLLPQQLQSWSPAGRIDLPLLAPLALVYAVAGAGQKCAL